MELIGYLDSDKTEHRLRMPKFGSVRNIQNCNNMDTFERRENVIKQLRDRTLELERGRAIPFKRISQGIAELLKLHPFPRYCGPFTGPIDGHWNPSWQPIMDSTDSGKKFNYFVTFVHSPAQECGTWTFDEDKTQDKMRPLFIVQSEKTKLYGPASSLSHSIIYPCEYGKCSIYCPCNICSSDEPCDQYCAKSPCEECDHQCPDHKCELDRTYSETDSFTIQFYRQNFDEEMSPEKITELSAHYRYSTYDPEDKFIKYAGIPRNCNRCQEDLLDHDVHHSVFHYRCKFCRKSLKLIKNDPIDSIQILKEKMKMKIEDGTTCAYCYKYFVNSTRRKDHEKTEHTVHLKPFKCDECSRSFASLVGLNHHQRIHSDAPMEYICDTCKQTFTAERTLKRHIESVHVSRTKERLFCDICEKSFTRADNLTRHIREAHKEPSVNTEYLRQLARPFECEHCGSRFKRKQKLDEHIVSSHYQNVPVIICEICSKTFSKLVTKKRHTDTVHNNISKNHKCLHCNKTFSRKDNLLKHVKHCQLA